MNTNQNSHLAELPQEIQLQILKELDTKSLCRISRVSNSLSKVCDDETIWKEVIRNEFDCTKQELSTYKQTAKLLFNRNKRIEYDVENEMMRLPFRCYGPTEEQEDVDCCVQEKKDD